MLSEGKAFASLHVNVVEVFRLSRNAHAICMSMGESLKRPDSLPPFGENGERNVSEQGHVGIGQAEAGQAPAPAQPGRPAGCLVQGGITAQLLRDGRTHLLLEGGQKGSCNPCR